MKMCLEGETENDKRRHLEIERQTDRQTEKKIRIDIYQVTCYSKVIKKLCLLIFGRGCKSLY